MILGIVAGASKPASVQALIVPHSNAPYVSAYPITTAGFGTKYPNPSGMPTDTVTGPAGCDAVAQSPNRKSVYLATRSATEPLVGYAWGASGFGTKLTAPAVTPPSGWCPGGLAFNSAGDLAMTHAAPNGFSVWQTSLAGVGTRYANPTGMPTANVYGGAVFTGGAFICAADDAIHAWHFTPGVGFGTKYPMPATSPAVPLRGCAYGGGAIFVVGAGAQRVQAYPWSDSSGFGTRAVPTGVAAYTHQGIGISPSGQSVVANNTAVGTNVSSWAWAGTAFGSSKGTLVNTGNGSGVAFSPPGDLVAMAHHGGDFINVRQWSDATGFGSALAAPAVPPSGNAYHARFVTT